MQDQSFDSPDKSLPVQWGNMDTVRMVRWAMAVSLLEQLRNGEAKVEQVATVMEGEYWNGSGTRTSEMK